MLVRVRETEGGGYKVTAYSQDGVHEERETASLQEAFDWQAHFSEFGEFPADPEPVVEAQAEPVHEPEVKKAKGKKK